MSRELRERLETAHGQRDALRERLQAVRPQLAEAERVAAALERRKAELLSALQRARSDNREMERETQRLNDNLPSLEGQRSAELSAVLFVGGSLAVVALGVLLMRVLG